MEPGAEASLGNGKSPGGSNVSVLVSRSRFRRAKYSRVCGGPRQANEPGFGIFTPSQPRKLIEVSVVEHLYRWVNWEIKTNSAPFRRTDSQKIEFRAPLKPDEERTISYSVHNPVTTFPAAARP
jgi:hypothetical protein